MFAAALQVGRVGLPAIAQGAHGASMLQYNITRLWRFLDNPWVEVSNALRSIIQQLLKRRKKRLRLAFDRREVKCGTSTR